MNITFFAEDPNSQENQPSSNLEPRVDPSSVSSLPPWSRSNLSIDVNATGLYLCRYFASEQAEQELNVSQLKLLEVPQR